MIRSLRKRPCCRLSGSPCHGSALRCNCTPFGETGRPIRKRPYRVRSNHRPNELRKLLPILKFFVVRSAGRRNRNRSLRRSVRLISSPRIFNFSCLKILARQVPRFSVGQWNSTQKWNHQIRDRVQVLIDRQPRELDLGRVVTQPRVA